MGISNISITNITDIETLEMDPGGGGPSPGGEPVFPKFAGLDQQASDSSGSANFASNVLDRMDLQDGDLLMAVISSTDNSIAVVTPTQAGWTALVPSIHRSTGATFTCFYRIVNTATDPTAYNFTWAADPSSAFLLNIRGADQVDPFPDAVVRIEGTNVPTSCPDITTSHDGMLVLNIAACDVGMKSQIGGSYESSTMATGNATYPYPVDSPGFITFSRIYGYLGTGRNLLVASVNHVRDAGLVTGASWPWSGGAWQSFAIAVKSASQ